MVKDVIRILAGPAPRAHDYTGLWSVLEAVFPIRFVVPGEGETGLERTPRVTWAVRSGSSGAWEEGGGPVLRLLPGDMPPAASVPRPESVVFSDERTVPFPFRGRSVETIIDGRVSAWSAGDGERVLARIENQPVWTVSDHKAGRLYCSGFEIPAIGPDQNLQDVLNGTRFVEILPLLEFLRHVCGDAQVNGPVLRACFMFDDPNLHWPRYGHVDFREIASQAQRHRYHVSFATVPLDRWFTHRPTAALFREQVRSISLLVHGNDHTHEELARAATDRARMRVLRQAIRRVEMLERTSGIEVSKVMAAPHGACSEDMLKLLPQHGFEAATISHGSLRRHNRGRSWTRHLGYVPAEMIRGCPVLPRWRLAVDAHNTVLLAAYLRQAIILVGHHRDLKDGTEMMDALAHFINGLGAVRWGSMAEMVQWGSSWHVVDGECVIEPLAGTGVCVVPAGVERFAVRPPPGQTWHTWKMSMEGTPMATASVGETIVMPGIEGRKIRVDNVLVSQPEAGVDVSLRPGLLPLSRRLLTEMRDRVAGLS